MRSVLLSHQNKIKGKMSHLVLVTEVTAAAPEVGGSDEETDSDEQRPLLRNEDAGCSKSSNQRDDAKVTTSYSLVPNGSLTPQVRDDTKSSGV